MNVSGIQVGQKLAWHHVVSNYGHVSVVHVTVRKIGKRITVEVPLKNGGSRLTNVTPHHLRPIASQPSTVREP